MNSRKSHRLITFCLVFLLSWVGYAYGQRGSFSAEDAEAIEQQWPGYQETPSGLRYVIDQEGTGEKPLRGMKVSVIYAGFLLDGTKFSENGDRENPFEFRLGAGDVIQGWEEAFADMRKGEKRILIIPYALGYGLKSHGEKIPRRSTLVFNVEVIDVGG